MRVAFALILIWTSLVFVSCDPVFANAEVDDHYELPDLNETVGSFEETSSTAREKSYFLDLAIGSETRLERSVGSDKREQLKSRRFSLGIAPTPYWLYQLHFGQLQDSSRSGTLKIEERSSELIASSSYLALGDFWFNPLVGLGIGVYQDNVRTSLGSLDSRSSTGEIELMGQVHGGFRINLYGVYLQLQAQVIQKEASSSVDLAFLSQLGLSL